MIEWLYSRFRSRYVVLMMFITRLFGSIGGALVIYYVLLTTHMPEEMRRHFVLAAMFLVPFAVLATVPLALWNTRTLRRVLRQLDRGQAVSAGTGQTAALEAVRFPRVQNAGEAVLVPLCAPVPMFLYLGLLFQPPLHIYVQITISSGLAVAAVLLVTYFASEQWMRVVVQDLLAHGVDLDFETLPRGRLRTRMVICFGLISLISTVMIGALANQRAQDLITFSERGQQHDAVQNLRQHTFLITLVSLVVGLVYSRMLAGSVASRVNKLVEVMKRVQAGALSERVQTAGNDEIDTLARQFNAMVEELDRKDRTVRDLNANLERKVRVRTRALARSKRSLQHSFEQLRESDRHKTEFFSNVSHELRTPLMMILSPLERLARRAGGEGDGEARSLLDVASINAQRLLKLINQLLDFAKLEAGHTRLRPESVALNPFVERLIVAARPLAEQRGLSLHAELDPSVGVIVADEEKLDTILTNLISNAIKFTPAGGQVRVRTTAVSGELSVVDEPQVLIDVEDTGIGIDEDNFVRLFQRFSQVDGSTSREFAGTGLGLALVKELVELHGGRVDVFSEPGRGSRFSVTLPSRCALEADGIEHNSPVPALRADRFADLLQYAAPEFPDPSWAAGAPPDAPLILVVDDLPEVRQMVGQVLRDEFRVAFAGDGETGWEAVLRERPDLIISDVMMPRVDGYEFARRVKQDARTSSIPFVLLTAQAQVTLKVEGLNVGADDYLVKPFNSEELLARVRSLLRLREMHTALADRNERLERTLEELRRTQQQLVQAEKMSSLGQLVAGLAHEINNSINAVYNGIPTIIERTDRLQRLVDAALADRDPDGTGPRQDISAAFTRIRSLATVVEEGADRTARIIGDMRKFSHPGQVAAELFDLNAALDVCVNLMDKQHRERVRVFRDYAELAPVSGPASQLHQVFLNLLTNAAQAMPDGGDVYITTRRVAEYVTVSIRDSGCGIPEEVRHRIFDPFFTTKPVGQGTGLGLSISYGIVSRLGGTIECHSLVGVGTEFIVRLPGQPRTSAGEAVTTALSLPALAADRN